MTTSPKGLSLIIQFEGCKLQAYRDQGGVWTIGVGHTSGVKEGDTCTQEQAQAWLAEDVRGVEKKVNFNVKVPLNQNQFDALVSFTFNIGHLGETMLKMLNSEDYQGAADQFLKWDLVNRMENHGLLRRRQAERTLFLEVV